MEISEIFEKFDNIGCLTFATINDDYPETRIAHLLCYDEEGLYFMTMTTKPFYKQLKKSGKVSICGLAANTQVEKVGEDNLKFDAGYFIRLTGEVKEVAIEDIKAKNNPAFKYCIIDQERYQAMTTFVIYKARGEIFDYDFEKEKRDHKLERQRFSFGGLAYERPGLKISDACIKCGICKTVCTFDAIYLAEDGYHIDGNRCDECGDCYIHCPKKAIISKGL